MNTLVWLILAFGVRLCGKRKVFFQDILSCRGVFQNELFLKESFNNYEMLVPNSSDGDQPQRFCLKSGGLSEP